MTDLTVHGVAATARGDGWRDVLQFSGLVVTGLALSAWFAWEEFIPAFFSQLTRLPPEVMRHADASVPAFAGWMFSALLVGVALSSATRLRDTSRWTRMRAALMCVLIGLIFGAAVHVLAGSVLPLGGREETFATGMPLEKALALPPYMLTNSELSQAQAAVRRQGGFSRRLSLIQQTRAWASLLPPVFGLLVGAAVVRVNTRRTLWHGLGLQAVLLVLLIHGMATVFTIALRWNPSPRPQQLAWTLLVVLTAGATWWWRRGLRVSD